MFNLSLFVLGAAMGSFTLALCYRLRHKLNFVNDRSVCENCKHILAATDLIPVISWLALRGRCRYCKKPITANMFLSELGLGMIFALSYTYWPHELGSALEITYFGLWLCILTIFSALFWYDLQWTILPNKLVYPLIALGFVDFVLFAAQADSFGLKDVGLLLVALVVASGFFLMFYVLSKGKWIGFGDVRLGIALGLLAARPDFAALNIFLASLIGTFVVLPFVYLLTRKFPKKLPFGPLLLVAAVIVRLFGRQIVDWYLASSGL